MRLFAAAAPLLGVLLGALPLAAEEPIVVKLATVAPDGSPWAQALQEYKKIAEAGAPGKLKVKLFLGGALGDENESVLACKRGQIQAVGASTGALASQVPELNVLEMPYLFKSFAEADNILDNVVRKDIEKHADDRGLHFGFWSENGYRNFGGSFPVKTPADLKGKKMRSQESAVHLAMYRALGASPVPIPTTEALHALQTGTVDGYDQSLLYTFAASWHTATKYITLSEHIYQPAAIVFHKPSWDAWPKDVKEALDKAGLAVEKKLRADVRAMNPILIEGLKESGVQVTVLDAAQRAAFEAVGVKARADALAKMSASEKALYAKIDAALKKK